jgi:hypothetical protein
MLNESEGEKHYADSQIKTKASLHSPPYTRSYFLLLTLHIISGIVHCCLLVGAQTCLCQVLLQIEGQ